MKYPYLLSILLLFCVSAFSQKQDRSNTFVFRCFLKDATNNEAISFAHIYNESRKYGAIADSSGYFATNVKIGDTLVLMALGYLGEIYIISEKDTLTTTVLLQSRTYQIGEVSLSIPRTYAEFKENFLEIDVDKDRPLKELPKHNPYITPQLLDTNIISSPSYYIFHPVSALYYNFNKEEKSKREVWYLQQQELRQGEVDAKYNKEIIAEITGFKDYELMNFMGWCNFSFNYLYETSAYDIRVQIESKYKEYISCCYKNEEPDTKSKRDKRSRRKH